MRRFITPMFVGLGLLLTGCSSEFRVDFQMQSSPPGYADVSSREIIIEEGLAVAVLLEPLEDGERMDEEAFTVTESVNPGVLGVTRRDVGGRYEDFQERAMVFTAKQRGSTTLEVFIYCDEDDRDFDTVEIPVTVLEQSE